MSNLQLFRVIVTKTWEAQAEALVLAPSAREAREAALQEVELDVIDGICMSRCATHKKRQIEDLQELTPDNSSHYYLIAPAAGRPDEYTAVDLAEFQAVLTSDDLETLRLQQIEADNGQIALLEEDG